MIDSTTLIGSENAAFDPGSSQTCGYSPLKIASLQDLLDALKENPPTGYAMLCTTAAKLSEFLGRPCETLPLESVADDDREGFRNFLRQRKYAENSVQSYSNYANMLVKLAKTLGWVSSPPVIPSAWLPLLPAIARNHADRTLRYLLRLGRLPETVTEVDLDTSVELSVRSGGSYTDARNRAACIRKVLVESGCGINLASKRIAKMRYGINLDLFPEPLRSEVKEVRHFKEARFVKNRKEGRIIRPITGKCLQDAIEVLFGYAVNIKGLTEIVSLEQLVTEEIVSGYLDWGLDVRQLNGESLRTRLRLIAAALGHNPKYSAITAGWLSQFISSITADTDKDMARRKEEKFLPYETLKSIPGMIRLDRLSLSKATPYEMAVSVRSELLLQWLVKLPWRQHNIRKMRIGGDKPNLVKASFPRLTSMSKPEWLVQAEKQDPGVEVWQVHFSKAETKTKSEIEFVLPQSLVPLLEEYISKHRPHLVRGSDPGTLFLNRDGKSLNPHTITDWVTQLTLKYGGRIVTPHLFRDIFAYMWLDKRPEDYLTLSKLLWHRNIETTIKIYGRRFNESAAVRKMEEVLGL